MLFIVVRNLEESFLKIVSKLILHDTIFKKQKLLKRVSNGNRLFFLREKLQDPSR